MSEENKENKIISVADVQPFADKIKQLFFSYEGVVDAKTFFGAYVLLGIFGLVVLRITGYSILVALLVVLFEAYAKSMLIQKRCRDFGNDGKTYLTLFFVSFLIPASLGVAKNTDSKLIIIFMVAFAALAVVWMVAFFKLLLKKSVENKNMELTAPFMKNRKTHIAVVVGATVIAVIMNIVWAYLLQSAM